MTDQQFPCNSCGLCCKMVVLVPELSDLDRGDGSCKHLVNDRCSIYETRPLICNVDGMYESVYWRQMSREQFYVLNLTACKQLQMKAGFPEEYQVKLPAEPVN
ncbi:hypothetical protein PAESOLCIP111_03427 [Paenibacillus solanacearum]|uniref:YkgJ family cysteine cluster protein n=1 Tax=Paenibacillus solanacearum TaxID=2048548 RepID=A0A916K2I2_9BACL|nr:hypothetical protein PAESOLCIP111_03427 [Paenibacillus solanacearum]